MRRWLVAWLLVMPRAVSAPPAPVQPAILPPVVDDDAPWRGDLYSWTTEAGAAKLRATRVAVSATAQTGGRVSPFNRLVVDLLRRSGPARELAVVLDGQLPRRRYAWPSPFATVMGLGPHGYGHTLVGLHLRPEAIVARLDPDAAEPVRCYDSANRRVPFDPRRLGAVLHVRREFREYVVVNEAMLARWEIGTPELAALVARERDMMLALAGHPVPAAWWGALAAWTEAYQPTSDRLTAIAAELARYDPAGPPLVVVPAPSHAAR